MNGAEFDFRDGPKGFVRVWKKVILDPWEFYREMPSSGGFGNPLIFLGISAIFYFLLRIAVSDLVDAVNVFFLVGLAYIFGPGVLMLACQYLFEGEGDYEGTLRLCSYAGSTLMLAWIPYFGIFAYLYSFYLVFLGTQKVHKLDATKAAIATLSTIVITIIVIFVLGGDRVRRTLLEDQKLSSSASVLVSFR